MTVLVRFVLLALVVGLRAGEPLMEVTPVEDTAAVLSNPDMGWVLYDNYPLDPAASTIVSAPQETFPGVDHVAVMFSWADVERAPGVFDFSAVDHACDFWRQCGKGIHLRLSSESLLWWSKRSPPVGTGIPRHVLALIPAELQQVRQESGKDYTVVDARHPPFRQHLRAFLAAVAGHFRGPRAVGLVDLRGFGLWGEWHSGYRYGSDADRHQALAGIIDLYADAFPDQRVALSYSHDPDGPKELYAGPTNRLDPSATATYEAFLRYSAFDHALTRTNVTWRRDGVGGAVYSNQRKLCEAAFALGRGPFMSEFVGGYAQAEKGGAKWLRWMVDDALSLHPNYVCLLGWQGQDALAFLRQQPDLVAHAHRTMGYRLVPLAVRHPAQLQAGQACRIASEWTNRGVGRAVRSARLHWSLVAADGATAASADGGQMAIHTWVRGGSARVVSEVVFKGVAPGRYALAAALIDPQGDIALALPLAGRRMDGSYPTGSMVTVGR
jgi:hypothetical protein